MLVITRGFGDALRIAYQNRPRIFDRRIVLPELLYERVIEARERVGAHGEMVLPLDEAPSSASCARPTRHGFRSVAIVFMHGYRYPGARAALGGIARAVGFTQVSVASRSAR